MNKYKNTVIKNIYYMLSYAYQNLQHKNYEKIKTEVFENIQDLFAAILAEGILSQLKQGLSKNYIEGNDNLSTLRGKINIKESIQLIFRNENKLSCCFDDLTENNIGYFLGTIICIDTSVDSINAPKREVVDGQQRLTTLSLLLAALYTTLQGYRQCMNDDQQADLLQLKRKLVLKGTESTIRVVPQTQNNNLDDYKGVLAEQKIISAHPMPKFAGLRRIKKAFEYFKKRVCNEIENIENTEGDTSEIILTTLFDILEKINSAVIVTIEVSSHADAYILFESLNNRGTPLTAVDLIKNLLLAQLDMHGNESLDYYFSRWQQV